MVNFVHANTKLGLVGWFSKVKSTERSERGESTVFTYLIAASPQR